jgi:ABC-type dipeptide/oligopeptide/nickel transport system permease subunit
MTSLWKHKNLLAGAVIIAAIVIAATVAPFVAPYDPYAQNLSITFQAPSSAHLFGTDQYGRDVLSRILYGTRLSIVEIVVGVGLALLLGVPCGLVSGYFGGAVDKAVTWTVDVLYAFPGIVLTLLIVAILGPNLINTLVAIAVFSVPVYARLTRNLTLSLKQMEFIEAARALGAGNTRILLRHVLPNALVPILVQATLSAGEVVLTASGLSFLGLGAQPPLAEWGAMMGEGRNFLGVATYLSLFPGAVITIAALGFNVLGDGLRDRLDPKLRG